MHPWRSVAVFVLVASSAGVARLGPGAIAYLPVDLAASAWVPYCLISDSASGRPHMELGMFRAIQVE